MALHTSRLAGALTALTLLAGVAVLPQSASAQMTPTTAPIVKPNRQERHPELRAALRALENARTALQKGAHDFGGERVEALKDTDKAIAEVKQALAKDQH